MQRTRSSRLSRTSEKQNKKQALFFTIGIVAILFILIQFGPLLVNVFGTVVYSLRGGDKSENTQVTGKELLQPPVLTGMHDATQSAKISFGGIAPDKEGTIEIYVNDDLEEEIALEGKANFSVNNISLRKGTNIIKARLIKDKQTSPFSQEYEVNYTTSKPKLEVNSPQDGQRFTKADRSIQISGNTDPDNIVTVNSFRAIVGVEGEFTYLLQLNDGENSVSVVAQNSAGVITQKDIKIFYDP